MKKKDKYDILEKQLLGLIKIIIIYFFKEMPFILKMMMDKVEKEEIDVEFLKTINFMLPVVGKVAHYVYETNKDIDNIDKEKLFDYLKTEGINIAEFSSNYLERVVFFTKILLILSIIEKEKIKIPNPIDKEVLSKIHNGAEASELFFEAFENATNNDENILEIINEKNYNLNEITESQKQLINNYHNRYMNNQIYPKVTKEIEDEKRIMLLAKKIGSKSKKII